MTEGFRYGDHNSEEVAATAEGLFNSRSREGRAIPKNVAIALAIKDLGKDLLLRSLSTSGTSLERTEAEELIFNELDPEQGDNFIAGLGGVLLGSLIETLHYSPAEGWKTNEFIDSFNRGISGTMIIPLKEEDFPATKPEDDKKATKVILDTLIKDRSFLGFFKEDWEEKLPLSIVSFLRVRPFWHGALDVGVATYKDAYNHTIKEN